MHILIVEDDERLATVIARVLREEAHVPEVAIDGETGLDMALSGTFDIVILDLMLGFWCYDPGPHLDCS